MATAIDIGRHAMEYLDGLRSTLKENDIHSRLDIFLATGWAECALKYRLSYSYAQLWRQAFYDRLNNPLKDPTKE